MNAQLKHKNCDYYEDYGYLNQSAMGRYLEVNYRRLSLGNWIRSLFQENQHRIGKGFFQITTANVITQKRDASLWIKQSGWISDFSQNKLTYKSIWPLYFNDILMVE